jgi:ADP-heptose:LPS heptosyltransferase
MNLLFCKFAKRISLKKILIIRFSSIGDIVLTTPVIRCIKTQHPNFELHFVTKKQFLSVLENNPYISKIHSFDGRFSALLKELQDENFDFVIDLHHSLRSRRLLLMLRKASSSFQKLNFKKWLLIKSKVNILPNIHVVDRYFKAAAKLNIENDRNGADFFISPDTTLPAKIHSFLLRPHVVAIAVGSKHETKQLPVDKIRELLKLTTFSAILLGGKEDIKKANEIIPEFEDRVMTACGQLSLQESALALSKCKAIVTGDTGLMHIATALQVKVFSIWGNTVPSFGMYPYAPKQKHLYDIFEVKGLKCRPCSKLGFKRCPKGHFKCMLNQDMMLIAHEITKHLLG